MAVKVINKETGSTVDVSTDEAKRGVLQGRYDLSGNVRVAKGLKTGSVEGSKVTGSLANGWEIIDSDQESAIKTKREAVSAGGQLQGGVERVVSGATFGGSDYALTKSGAVDAKDLAARKAALGGLAQPLEIAGAIAPTLLSGGAGAAGTAARLTPAGIAARGGTALAKGTTRALGGKAVAKVAGSAVGGAFEGALQGAGGVTSEAALGNKELTTEHILAGMGQGAGLGSLFSAGTTSMGLGMSGAFHGTQRVSRKLMGKALTGADDAAASGFLREGVKKQVGLLSRGAGHTEAEIASNVSAAERMYGRAATKEGRELSRLAQASARDIETSIGQRMRGGFKSSHVDDVAKWERDFSSSSRAGKDGASGVRKDLVNWVDGARSPKPSAPQKLFGGRAAELENSNIIGKVADLESAKGMRNLAVHSKGYSGATPDQVRKIAAGEIPSMTGRKFDPVQVVDNGLDHADYGMPRFTIRDGRHRIAAARQAGATRVRAKIHFDDESVSDAMVSIADDVPSRALSPGAASRVNKLLKASADDLIASPAKAHKWISKTADGTEQLIDELRTAGATSDADMLGELLGSMRGIADDAAMWGPASRHGKAIYAAEAAHDAAMGQLPPKLRKAIASGSIDDKTLRSLAQNTEGVEAVLVARGGMADALEKTGAKVEGLRKGIAEVKDAIGYGRTVTDAASDWNRIKALERDPGGTVRRGLENVGSSAGAMLGNFTFGGAMLGQVAGKVAGLASRPAAVIRTVARVRGGIDAIRSRQGNLIKGFEGLVDGTRSAARKGAQRAARVAPLAARKAQAQRRTKLLETVARISRMAADPVALAEELDDGMIELRDAVPNVAGSVIAGASRAAQYLAAVAPAVYRPSFEGGVEMVDPFELDAFEMKLQAVTDPIGTLELLPQGAMTLDHSEALKAVYPQIFGGLQQQIMEIVGKREREGKPVSFAARTQLGLLGEVATDDSMRPQDYATIQASMAPAPSAEPGPQPGPSPVDPPPLNQWQRLEAGG